MTASRQRIILVIVLALAPVLVPGVPRAASVVNIQKKLHKADRGGLFGALNGTVNWKKGNTNLLSIEADLGTFYSRHPHLVYVSLAFAYGTVNMTQDAWNEQLWKRDTVDWKIPSGLLPRLEPIWLVTLALAAAVALALRWESRRAALA